MTQIQTAPTTLTSLTVEDTGFNVRENRWKIRYFLTRTEMLTTKESREPSLPNTFRTVVIQDTPETPIFDEDGVQTGTTPAGTAYSDWFATWNTHEEMLAASEAAAIAHANIVEWDGTVIDDITNDPNAANVKPWVAGDLLAPPNRVEYLGVWYDIVQPHTASATFPPPIAALYSVSAEQPGGGGGPVFTVWSAQTYALDAYVSHNAKFWQNRRPNNSQQGEPGTDGSGWMEVTQAGLLQGTWYNLGNEGYPIGYIATGTTCYLNDTANNTFGPTVFGWSVTPCP